MIVFHLVSRRHIFTPRREKLFFRVETKKNKSDLGYVVMVVIRLLDVVVGLWMMVWSVRVRQLMSSNMLVRHRFHHVHVVHGFHGLHHGLLLSHLHVIHVVHHLRHLFHLHMVHHHGFHGLLLSLGLHHVFGHELGVVTHVLDERMVLIMKSVVLGRGRGQGGGQENHQFELQLDFG